MANTWVKKCHKYRNCIEYAIIVYKWSNTYSEVVVLHIHICSIFFHTLICKMIHKITK